ncbi:TIGR03915 family putative DNA repair protein [Bacteroides sp. OttesenSCG-928-J23]|nr:TIGR03915 family putative DNA repair protein [Bacteroides sp. OttesenSCG-928-J23]MDL2306117.1 TIGR03915 family putative DNA repair protein [Bacteroides sp. OttesenSCG-928-D19]
MTIFVYDKTFEGLLTVVFDAYFRKSFPDMLLGHGEPFPLFYDDEFTVITDEAKAARVWKGLEKRLSDTALSLIARCWLSELPQVDIQLFRYMRKAIDSPQSMELNFNDPDVLELTKIWRKVNYEAMRVVQFTRFQKAVDGTYFAAFEPEYNVFSLCIHHFADRFADQRWLIYDIKRQYGYYYDLQKVEEVTFDTPEAHLVTGMLDESLMATDEKLFQKMWKTYFKAIAIKERINPRLHKQHIPVRYWKYLTEKQG